MATLPLPLMERLLQPAARRGLSRRIPSSQAVPALVLRIKEGLTAAAFTTLCEAYAVPRERMSRVVQIPLRTLARRTVFKPEESERIVRLGRLFQRAVEVLGTEADAREWFHAPQPAIGGATPLDYADTEPGAREVEELIGRLEHGVFM